MRGWSYYNEWDADAAAWLRELIADGLLPAGEVDTRSIADVRPDDLAGFRQCHFFAGIGGWPFALRLAGWPDDRPVWTGSPPCQPFSAAGQQRGVADERHLAPVWAELVAACCPERIYGEQVASAAILGRASGKDQRAAGGDPAWLDVLFLGLEEAGYACGASDLPAAGIGAPHIRQRTWFVASRLDHAPSARHIGPLGGAEVDPRDEARLRVSREGRGAGGLAHGLGARLEGHAGHGDGSHEPGRDDAHAPRSAWPGGDAGGVAEPDRGQRHGFAEHDGHERDGAARGRIEGHGEPAGDRADDRPDAHHSGWANPDWLLCRDGKWRPVEPSVLGVADGVPGELVRSGAFVPASSPLAGRQAGVERNAPGARRTMRLRGYGNAIVPQIAAEWIVLTDAQIGSADAELGGVSRQSFHPRSPCA